MNETKSFDKSKIINGILWVAFVLALVSSISHLAYTFGTVERDPLWGWVSAIAVDAGLAALAYTIQQRKRTKQTTAILWVGVAGFAVISGLANFYHALSVETTGAVTVAMLKAADWLQVTKAIILSATLPAMVIYLGEVVSSDDAQTANKADQEEQRRKNQEERQQRKQERELENETKRLELKQQEILLEQQKQQNEQARLLLEQQEKQRQQEAEQEAEQEAAQVEQPLATGVHCERCGITFKNRQAFAAHGCNKNGKHVVTLEAPLNGSTNGKVAENGG